MTTDIVIPQGNTSYIPTPTFDIDILDIHLIGTTYQLDARLEDICDRGTTTQLEAFLKDIDIYLSNPVSFVKYLDAVYTPYKPSNKDLIRYEKASIEKKIYCRVFKTIVWHGYGSNPHIPSKDQRGRVDLLRWVVSQGRYTPRLYGDSLLGDAVCLGNIDMVRTLIEYGLDLMYKVYYSLDRSDTNIPLCRACGGGQVDMVEYLTSIPDVRNSGGIGLLIETIKRLNQYKDYVPDGSARAKAILYRLIEVYPTLLIYERVDALIAAITCEHPDIVQTLIPLLKSNHIPIPYDKIKESLDYSTPEILALFNDVPMSTKEDFILYL